MSSTNDFVDGAPRGLAWWSWQRWFGCCAYGYDEETAPLLATTQNATAILGERAYCAARLAFLRLSGPAFRDQDLPPARRAPMTPAELQAAQERCLAAVAAAEKRIKLIINNNQDRELYTS